MEHVAGVFDPTDQQQWLKLAARENLPPAIISVAITGGMQGKEINPNHPESAEEQAKQSHECYKAGASIVHVHARQPEDTSLTSGDPEVYRRVNALIREKCPDIIINNTTGGGLGVSTEEELTASIKANPEICSLDMGPLTLRGLLKKRPEPLPGPRGEDVAFEHCTTCTFAQTERYAKAMLDAGIKPELEVWHSGQYWLVHNLIEKGLVEPPYLVQFVMGFQSGAYATPKEIMHLMEVAPKPSVFSVVAIGLLQTTTVAQGLILGINVRTGMEDNILYKRGELCQGNAPLVEKAVRMARELNREVATPQQARQMLGLSDKPTQY
jgi:3-keto-5-aminohexanoate cleavage enzyme